jgi:hypothetical protein
MTGVGTAAVTLGGLVVTLSEELPKKNVLNVTGAAPVAVRRTYGTRNRIAC